LAHKPDPRDLHSFPTRRSSDLLRPRRPRRALASSTPPTAASKQRSCPKATDSFTTTPMERPGRSYRSTRDMASMRARIGQPGARSEEHTSELQSLTNLVCRLLL